MASLAVEFYVQIGGDDILRAMDMERRQFLILSSTALAAAAMQAQPARRFLGLTIMPEYIQSEGIDGILRSLHRVGATAVATSPYVIEEADENSGSREPPGDAGAGSVRLLDRPLFGKRELYMRTAPSFEPDPRLYQGLRYQPAVPDALTWKEGAIVGDFIREARAAGFQVYLQFQAAIPPGYRVQFGGAAGEDVPRLPDGSIPPRRVDKNGSLASQEIRGYTNALIRDLCRVYPQIHGIRTDWPEYPPYLLDSAFLDFSPPAQAAAQRLGLPWERMRADASSSYRFLLGSLTNRHLEQFLADDGGRFALLGAMAGRPGIADWLSFKATLVEELLQGFRQTLTEAAGASVELMPNAFPPPFTSVSGFDFQRASAIADSISVKLYTMHWPMMLRFYGNALLGANPGLSDRLLGAALVQMMDIAEESIGGVSAYAYPPPDVAHPVSLNAQRRKIKQAQRSAGDTPIIALAHGYGPLSDFAGRLRVAWEASNGRIWVNRYGYLTDEKLDQIGSICRN